METDDGKAKVIVQQRGTNWLFVLGVIFVLFKLCGITEVAEWSWWVVLLPFYVGIAIMFGIVMLTAACAAVVFVGGVAVIAFIGFCEWVMSFFRK